MLTNKTLTEMGYSQNKASNIIMKLERLRVPVHKVRLHDTHQRNGITCDHLRTVKGFVLEEAIVALNSHIETHNDRFTKTWVEVLDALIEMGEGR